MKFDDLILSYTRKWPVKLRDFRETGPWEREHSSLYPPLVCSPGVIQVLKSNMADCSGFGSIDFLVKSTGLSDAGLRLVLALFSGTLNCIVMAKFDIILSRIECLNLKG